MVAAAQDPTAPPPTRPTGPDFYRTDVAGLTVLEPRNRTAEAWLRARAYDQWRYAGALILERGYRDTAIQLLRAKGFTIEEEPHI